MQYWVGRQGGRAVGQQHETGLEVATWSGLWGGGG